MSQPPVPIRAPAESPSAQQQQASPVTDAELASADLSCCGKSAGRPRAADVEARLQNLLAAATDLFLQHGYSNVSLEAIARQAHVAVRTIYVKFGGKAGLLHAIINDNRERYFHPQSGMATDHRPVEQVLSDFGISFLKLIYAPAAIKLHRMVVAESMSNPELADTFNNAGPLKTREIVGDYFARPEIAVQFRSDMSSTLLTTHLLNCIMGEQMSRFLYPNAIELTESELRDKVAEGLKLFFRGTLGESMPRSAGS